MDDESILSVEATTNLRPLSWTIALNSSQKEKQNDSEISNNAFLIFKSLEKTTIVLVQVLVDSKRKIASLSSNAKAFDKKISDIEYQIEAKIKAHWDNIKVKLVWLFVRISIAGNNNSS